jgi:hypothetical protein
MYPKLNPYHFRAFTRRFTLIEVDKPLPSSWVGEVSITAMDRLIAILKPSIGLEAIKSLTHLESLRDNAIAKCSALDPEDRYEGDDIETSSLTNYLHFALGPVQSRGDVDWQGFSDFLYELDPQDRRRISSLISVFTGMTPGHFLAPPSSKWLSPTKINELATGREILGRLFIETGEQKWLRADRAVQKLVVEISITTKDWDEEIQEEFSYVEEVEIGTAATLAGAFEIAEQAIAQVEAVVDSEGIRTVVGRAMPFEIRILPAPTSVTRDSKAIIVASVQADLQPNGEFFVETASARWIEPLNEKQSELARREIQDLQNEIFEDSPADNYDTYQRLRRQIKALEARFPVEGYPGSDVMKILRETLVAIDAQRSITSMLEYDLGL